MKIEYLIKILTKAKEAGATDVDSLARVGEGGPWWMITGPDGLKIDVPDDSNKVGQIRISRTVVSVLGRV